MSGNVFFNSIPSHSQWFIPIPIPDHRFSLVLFPFPLVIPIPSAPIPIKVDVFCQFIAALMVIVFWVAEILEVKDTALLSWWAMTIECSTVREVPGEADVAQLTHRSRAKYTHRSLPLTGNGKNGEFSFPPIPIKPFPFP